MPSILRCSGRVRVAVLVPTMFMSLNPLLAGNGLGGNRGNPAAPVQVAEAQEGRSSPCRRLAFAALLAAVTGYLISRVPFNVAGEASNNFLFGYVQAQIQVEL